MAPALQALALHRNQPSPIRLDAVKLSHHGSRANVTSDLFRMVQADHYIVSTNGAIFGHPDEEAIARVIVHGGRQPRLWFNHDNERSRRCANPALRSLQGYDVVLPQSGQAGVALTPAAKAWLRRQRVWRRLPVRVFDSEGLPGTCLQAPDQSQAHRGTGCPHLCGLPRGSALRGFAQAMARTSAFNPAPQCPRVALNARRSDT